MKDNEISPSDLARRMGITKNSVSRLRQPKMPRMDDGKLNHLIICLNALRKEGKPLINVNNLLVLSFTVEEAAEARISES
ncbi:MAG: helix-turn-helix transcriptional regulator [Acaryochloris sp. CRU_2_0]|nr:helix-turn-helix transcriptional regulator [Acaryochloris sp. CRU_2_0]